MSKIIKCIIIDYLKRKALVISNKIVITYSNQDFANNNNNNKKQILLSIANNKKDNFISNHFV